MKKKTLIIPVVAAMLAVSCGNSDPGKDWSSEIKGFMTSEMGEVLPYLDLDAESLYWVAEKDEFGGHFYAQDDNETDLVADYGDRLKSAGFVFNDDAEAYYKTNSKAEIKVSLEYFEGSDSYKPGNTLDLYYLYKDAPTGGDWDADIKGAMESALGTVLPYAYLDPDTIDVMGELESALEGLFMVYDENDSNKVASYPFRLEKAGFVAGIGTYGNCMIADTSIGRIGVYAAWDDGSESGYAAGNEIFVEVALTENYVDYFPYVEVTDFYDIICYYLEDETDFKIPDFKFDASEEPMFYYTEEWENDLYADIYTYGTTVAELDAYAIDLAKAGWCLVGQDGHDYIFAIPDTHFKVVIVDYSEYMDPEDPYTANITFYYDQSYIAEYTNISVAATLGMRLGLDVYDYSSEGQPIYVMGLVESVDLAAVRDSVMAAIPGLNSYYYWSEDYSKVEYDEEDPTKIVAYEDYFLVDGWEEGNQYIYVAVYPSTDNPEVETAIYMEVAGEPVVKEWSAYSALLAMVKLTTPAGSDPADEITDYSEQAGFPAYGANGFYTTTIENVKAFPEQLIVEGRLKGFEVLGDWEQDPEDGTWFISYSNGKVTLKFWVYSIEYQGTTYTVLEMGSYEYPEVVDDVVDEAKVA